LTTIYPLADLRVTQTPSASNVVAGTTVNFTNVVSNLGPATAPSVVLSNTLPAGVVFVSSSVTPASQSGNLVTWNLGSLAVNASTSTATNVVLTDPLPSPFAFVTSPPPPCTVSNGVVTCPLGNLANGAISTVNLLVQSPAIGIYTNIATVASTGATDLITNNN